MRVYKDRRQDRQEEKDRLKKVRFRWIKAVMTMHCAFWTRIAGEAYSPAKAGVLHHLLQYIVNNIVAALLII
jgi:hypothetical protein